MNLDLLRSLINRADEEDIRQLLSQVDFLEVFEQMLPMVEEDLEPHFEEIRERAQAVDGEEIREFYAELSESEQQEAFDDTLLDLLVTLRECRDRPQVGFPKLKTRLRDPHVLEPLLLIAQNEAHIDAEYSRELKAFLSETTTWAAAELLPEIYTEAEREGVDPRKAGP